MTAPPRLTLLTEDEVSEWVRVPVNTLRSWRVQRINIPFIPVSARTVRYDQDSVNAYLKSREVEVAVEPEESLTAA